MVQGVVEAWAFTRAARMILEDAFAACFPERVALEVESLGIGGNTSVAY